MKNLTKKSNQKKELEKQKNAVASKNNNLFLEMIVEGIENLDATEWEHYLKQEIDFEPKNLFTKTKYKRFNRLTLFVDMLVNQWAQPYYASFKQISEAGGKIKKGAKSRVIQYFNFVIKHKTTGKNISLNIYNDLPKEEAKNYTKKAFVKFYRVFNVAWIENINDIDLNINSNSIDDLEMIDLNEDAELLIKKLQSEKGLKLKHEIRNTGAYYPALDIVCMPEMKMFKNDVKYYSTLFHELVHWTGNKNRLNRFDNFEVNDLEKKEQNYAFEELVAEIGSMLIYFEFELKSEFINSLVYLKGWLNNTSKDTSRIETLEDAFKESNKAVSYIYA